MAFPKYLLLLDHIRWQRNEQATIAFGKGMDSVTACVSWRSTFKAVLCDDLVQGMDRIEAQVRTYLLNRHWIDCRFMHTVVIQATYSQIDETGALWHGPTISCSETERNLKPYDETKDHTVQSY